MLQGSTIVCSSNRSICHEASSATKLEFMLPAYRQLGTALTALGSTIVDPSPLLGLLATPPRRPVPRRAVESHRAWCRGLRGGLHSHRR